MAGDFHAVLARVGMWGAENGQHYVIEHVSLLIEYVAIDGLAGRCIVKGT